MRQTKTPPTAKKTAAPGHGAKPALATSRSPRKLPLQPRANATVSAILEAAAQILETQGLEAYTTNAIAERAGASIGSLYQYFPNKAALTQALIEREDSALGARLTTLLDQPSGIGLLRALLKIAVEHQLQRPVLARLLDAEEARLPPRQSAQPLHALLMSIFIRALGEARLAREPRLPQDLFAIIHGMVDAAGQHGEDDSDALIGRIERAVWGYLRIEDEPVSR
ncbi:TetR/AcrR family transcriptional regulator [Burkholderia sp. Ax-1719]|uniref:TetR/AcrR family transcriptional regulator n=1 Tax=Burkholderia sp. Ax-1719 TaxID=2608334 RepID=UPI0014203C32|nr:TetR/AcrR family transcriptional regulator [Burkholderia sp. Ax-1719]NIE64824.1 TetR/AcrR family transcriptional regulator [Burkholderia sp. Ax-1719]